jgi:hypothetical protein
MSPFDGESLFSGGGVDGGDAGGGDTQVGFGADRGRYGHNNLQCRATYARTVYSFNGFVCFSEHFRQTYLPDCARKIQGFVGLASNSEGTALPRGAGIDGEDRATALDGGDPGFWAGRPFDFGCGGITFAGSTFGVVTSLGSTVFEIELVTADCSGVGIDLLFCTSVSSHKSV